MFYLIIQLFKTEYKEDILLALTSCGIQRGNVFEGQNLDKVLKRDFPLFTGFLKSEDNKERFSMQISAVVQSEKKMDDLIHILKEADIDIQKEDILRMILLPVERIAGYELKWERGK